METTTEGQFPSSSEVQVAEESKSRKKGYYEPPKKLGAKGAKEFAEELAKNDKYKTLNFTANGIGKKGAKAIAEALQKNRTVETIILENNDIGSEGFIEIMKVLSSNKTISKINVAANSIGKSAFQNFPEIIEKADALAQLNLSFNPKIASGAKMLSEGIRSAKFLTVLHLSQCGLGNKGGDIIGKVLQHHKTLTDVDLSSNKLGNDGAKKIAEVIEHNQVLKRLNLGDNGIGAEGSQAVGRALCSNASLTDLDFRNNRIKKKGSEAFGRALINPQLALKFLCLRSTQLRNQGGQLIGIGLSENKGLIRLDLSFCEIGNIAAEKIFNGVKFHKTLSVLSLANNEIGNRTGQAIRMCLLNNRTLTWLDLSTNPLGNTAAKDIAQGLRLNKSLTELLLKQTAISNTGLGHLSTAYAESLNLKNIFIARHLLHFTRKTITGRELVKFPPQLLELTHLRSLSLESNCLTSIPDAITQLTNLRDLDISFNKISALPLALIHLTNLRTLKTERNPLKTPPPEIIRQGIRPIMNYLKELAEGSEPCYRCKLMIVGQGDHTTISFDLTISENVGKTTLLSSLRGIKREKDQSTDGIEIADWPIKVNFKDESGRSFKQDVLLSSWDFAGQELYYSTHQFFLSIRSIYILVFDMRYPEENSRVEFWLQSIEARAKDAPVIIVGTHLDDKKCTKEYIQNVLQNIETKFTKRFSNIKCITCIDATKDLQDFRAILKGLIAQQEHMGENLPKTYLEFEKILRKTIPSPPIITWKEYIKLAKFAHIEDPETLAICTKMFHELGSIVHFDDPGLKNIVILNPQFLTDLLSTIVTTKHKLVRNGILNHRDLTHIWREPDFPTKYHGIFLALFEKFEIGFQLISKSERESNENNMFSQLIEPSSSGEGRYIPVDESAKTLIPSLLEDEDPLLDEFWPALCDRKKKHLERLYFMDFIPSGLFSRLMVRMLHVTDQIVKYWKNGAVLTSTKNKFLIRLYPAEKVLKIAVRGKNPSDLNRIIVETITNLITSWFQIQVRIKVPCPQCVTNNPRKEPFMFSVEECTEAVCGGKMEVSCGKGHAISLEDIVPDIAMADFDGRKIDLEKDIKLEKEVGRGAFGIIHKAQLLKSHSKDKSKDPKFVAVKVLNIQSDVDPIERFKAFTEFRREAWLMRCNLTCLVFNLNSGLRHPCIVGFYGFSVNPFAVIMELVEYGDLYSYLHDEKQPLTWTMRLKIALNIAAGMAFLHNVDPPLVHRDLKTPNVLMASKSEKESVIAKITDFGTSIPLFISAFKEKSADRVVALPTWLAPEIINEEAYTEKSDIYAFGIIMWELLTRKHPFDEFKFMSQLEDAVVEGHRPPLPPDCPTEYATLMRACWDGDPQKRPPYKLIVKQLRKIAPLIVPGLQLPDFSSGTKEESKEKERKKDGSKATLRDCTQGKDKAASSLRDNGVLREKLRADIKESSNRERSNSDSRRPLQYSNSDQQLIKEKLERRKEDKRFATVDFRDPKNSSQLNSVLREGKSEKDLPREKKDKPKEKEEKQAKPKETEIETKPMEESQNKQTSDSKSSFSFEDSFRSKSEDSPKSENSAKSESDCESSASENQLATPERDKPSDNSESDSVSKKSESDKSESDKGESDNEDSTSNQSESDD